jgi:hypothetical protein
MEQMIDSLPLQCKHFEAGCSFETTEGNARMKKHESECLFKPVACPHTACDRQVPMTQMEAHVIFQHKANMLDCSSDGLITVEWPANIDLSLNHWKLSLVMLNGQMVLPMIFKKENLYYAWLAVSSASHSDVGIVLKGKKGRHLHRYTGQTLGIGTGIDYVTRNPEKILTFSNVHAKQCMTKNGQGRCVLKVTFKLMMEEFDSVAKHVMSGSASACAISSTISSAADDKTKGKQSFCLMFFCNMSDL